MTDTNNNKTSIVKREDLDKKIQNEEVEKKQGSIIYMYISPDKPYKDRQYAYNELSVL